MKSKLTFTFREENKGDEIYVYVRIGNLKDSKNLLDGIKFYTLKHCFSKRWVTNRFLSFIKYIRWRTSLAERSLSNKYTY